MTASSGLPRSHSLIVLFPCPTGTREPRRDISGLSFTDWPGAQPGGRTLRASGGLSPRSGVAGWVRDVPAAVEATSSLTDDSQHPKPAWQAGQTKTASPQ